MATRVVASGSIVVDCEDPGCGAAHELMAELSSVLAEITGSGGQASFDISDMALPGAVLVVAREGSVTRAGGALLGCGALRPLDGGIAELKRMYARPGSGAGLALLQDLEQRALAFGYREIWLETRRVNQRAVDFYLRNGYRPIAKYGKYIGRDDAICLGKRLENC